MEDSLRLTPEGVEKFLSSDKVEGIGPVYARKIVDRFGIEALDILRNNPERIEEIDGIGRLRAEAASESIKKIPYPIRLLVFLYSCGVSDMYIDRIFGKYRKRAEEIISSDPYSMVEDVWQLSFFTADKIGRNMGIAPDDSRRLRGALLTAVKHYADDGHLFATSEEASRYAASITGVDEEKVTKEIDGVVGEGRLVLSRGGLYLPVFYKAEKEGAEKLTLLASQEINPVKEEEIPRHTKEGADYSEAQIDAIRKTMNSPVAIVTGGPGSGKTTVLHAVIGMLEDRGKKVVLCAPTGRAAKRMTMLTDRPARTIHSLLGYRQGEGYSKRMIDADALIIDEGSMMEQVLFNHLLEALKPSTRVILVGDVDQLPAIGAGDVLRDMIDSGSVAVARLEENFRQAEGSMIVSGARAINSGQMPDSGRDFLIVEEESVKDIHDKIVTLMAEELPRTRDISASDIQVVTPQQIGPIGARQLNIDLQAKLNPEGESLRRGSTIMRLGDPVMQTANSKERGVYNGETGVITAVYPEKQTLEVTFGDGRKSEYRRSDLSELVLAYATTVHKLQGSEVKNMIFPITMAHKPMLYRNLLYTGVSRATDLCILVGEKEALRYAIGNVPSGSRNSNFKERLQESPKKLLTL